MIFTAWLYFGMAQALSEEQELSEWRAVGNVLLSWTRQCNVSQAFLNDCNANKSPKTLQLWGERHSGTNMIEHVLKTNFRIDERLFAFGFKHMFVGERNESIWEENFATAKKQKAHHIVMSRSLYGWTDGLKNEKDYQDNMPNVINQRSTFEEFVTQPWRCMIGKDVCYDNILDLRRHKFRSLIANLGDINVEKNDEEQILQRDTGRALFVRYEDLSSDFGISVACRIITRLKLCPLDELLHPVVQFVKPGYNFGSKHELITDAEDKRVKNRNMWKGEEALDTLNDMVDWDVENYMGYTKLTRSTSSYDRGT